MEPSVRFEHCPCDSKTFNSRSNFGLLVEKNFILGLVWNL
jgi:hypothetical protein